MTVTELLQQLKSRVSEEEYEKLKRGRLPHVSAANTKLLLQLMADDRRDDSPVDPLQVTRLEQVTNDYLRRYLDQYPQSWKWVFLCCAYTAFILRIPMHPQDWVHYTEKTTEGQTVYFCPQKSRDPDTNCAFCVCRYPEENT